MQNFNIGGSGFTNIKISDMGDYDPNLPNREGVVWNTAKIDRLLSDYRDGSIDIRGYKNSPFFTNDVTLRKPNLLYEYTQEEMEEIRRCAADPIYFGEKYAQVLTDDGIIRIKFRDYQLEIMEGFINHKLCVLLSSRQIGKTISSAIYIVWFILFHKDKNVLIVADIEDTTKEIIDKIKNIIYNLPFFMKPGMVINNVRSMKFENGCRIIGRSTTKKTGIGLSINLLYMDEFAHINESYLNFFYRAIYPTITGLKDSRIIITSTPRGLNRFSDIWEGAIAGENEYYPMRVDWWQVEGRDEGWKKRTIANLGSEEDFNQEFGLQFFASDDLMLDSIDLKKMYNIRNTYESRHFDGMIVDRVTYKEGGVKEETPINYSKFLKWNKKFLANEIGDNPDLKHSKHFYIFSIDTSEGVGKDYSVVNLFKLAYLPLKYLYYHRPSIHEQFDIFTIVQVGCFRSNTINADTLANVVNALVFDIFNFNNVRVALELNNKGELVKNRMEVHGNYWPGLLLHSKHTDAAEFYMPGLLIGSGKKKVEYCEKFQHLLSLDRIIPNEITTVAELSGMGKNKTGTSYRCQLANDDMAMSSVNTVSFFDSPQYYELCEELYYKMGDEKYIKEFEINILEHNRRVNASDGGTDMDFLKEINN